MGKILLTLPEAERKALWNHLLPDKKMRTEEAAFAWVHSEVRASDLIFTLVTWCPVLPHEFVYRSEAYLELVDEVRPRVIKQAHDLDASVVEFHSHLGTFPAQFSRSDLWGLQEVVPHVRWRLKGRPYVAIVVAQRSFDAL